MITTLLARLIARPRVANWLIQWAQKTPDEHIPGYMDRYWLFNPYDRETRKAKYPRIPFSIRIHHILREDYGDDPHDHPWNARTVILRGWYIEHREDGSRYMRTPGDTATINFNEYHHIDMVSQGGAWTFFIMGKYRGVWGFLRDGVKIDFKTYLAKYPR